MDLIENATLNIYHNNPYREEIAVHRMLKGWKEKEVTFDRPNAGAPSWAGGWVPGTNYALDPTAKVSVIQAGRWYAIDVTSDVKAFLSGTAPNNGWFLKSAETIGDDGDPTAFISREGRVGQRPFLLIKHRTDSSLKGNKIQSDSSYSTNWNSVGWAPTTHKQIMVTTSLRAGIPQEWAQVVAEFSDDPDYWIYSGNEKLNRILKAREHYWNPDIDKWEYIPGFGRIVGAAPSNCELFSILAKSGNENNPDTYINLGLASHFLIDVGNPMHTDKVVETVLDGAVHHDNYELYVALNWTDGQNLFNVLSNDLKWNSVRRPALSTKNLARYSHGYLDYLYEKVSNCPKSFHDNSTAEGRLVERITQNCLRITGRNVVGLISYTRNKE